MAPGTDHPVLRFPIVLRATLCQLAIVASGLSSGLKAGEAQPVAFTHGFHNALQVASLIALAGAAVALATVRKPRLAEQSRVTALAEV